MENKKLVHKAGPASNHKNFINTGIVKIVQIKTQLIHPSQNNHITIYHIHNIIDEIQTDIGFHFSAENIEII